MQLSPSGGRSFRVASETRARNPIPAHSSTTKSFPPPARRPRRWSIMAGMIPRGRGTHLPPAAGNDGSVAVDSRSGQDMEAPRHLLEDPQIPLAIVAGRRGVKQIEYPVAAERSVECALPVESALEPDPADDPEPLDVPDPRRHVLQHLHGSDVLRGGEIVDQDAGKLLGKHPLLEFLLRVSQRRPDLVHIHPDDLEGGTIPGDRQALLRVHPSPPRGENQRVSGLRRRVRAFGGDPDGLRGRRASCSQQENGKNDRYSPHGSPFLTATSGCTLRRTTGP